MHYIKLFEEAISALNDNLYVFEQVYPDIYKLSKKGNNGASVGLVALTHGDEIEGLHILTEITRMISRNELVIKGDIYLILANKQAYLKNQRYIEKDLNRLYGQQSLGSTIEEKRVVQIKEVLQRCDYVVDFHQTIEETLYPFFILPFNQEAYEWITAIASDVPIILRNVSKAITTLSSYVESLGKKGVTFEVGSNGIDKKQLALGVRIAINVLDFAYNGKKNHLVPILKASVYDLKYLQSYSTGKVKFRKKFKNFEQVEEGETIAYLDGSEVITPISGKLLLYPQKWFKPGATTKPDGLFFVMQEVDISKL